MAWILMGLACGGKVASEESAELAYLGVDGATEKALDLGIQGYNLASSANIDPQSADGDEAGTITVSGQVDQGSSDNKGLRLDLLLEGYADLPPDDAGHAWVYDTDPSAMPLLDLKLRDVPDGTLEGTLVGTFAMTGDLEGEVALDLVIAGEIADDDADGVSRVDGTTTVTGTATSAYGVFDVDVTR